VLNWSISRNYKEICNSTKISVTPVMYLTRGGNVQRPLTSGPRGWPAGRPSFMSIWHAASCTCVYTRRGRPRWWRMSVEAKPHGRPALWLGWLATTWQVTDLTKSVTPPWTPINTPLLVKIRTHTTFWRFHLQSFHS
jgi:hypothetical protein